MQKYSTKTFVNIQHVFLSASTLSSLSRPSTLSVHIVLSCQSPFHFVLMNPSYSSSAISTFPFHHSISLVQPFSKLSLLSLQVPEWLEHVTCHIGCHFFHSGLNEKLWPARCDLWGVAWSSLSWNLQLRKLHLNLHCNTHVLLYKGSLAFHSTLWKAVSINKLLKFRAKFIVIATISIYKWFK